MATEANANLSSRNDFGLSLRCASFRILACNANVELRPLGSQNNQPKNSRTKFRKKECPLPNIIPVEIVLFCAVVRLKDSDRRKREITGMYGEAVSRLAGSVHIIYGRRSASNRTNYQKEIL